MAIKHEDQDLPFEIAEHRLLQRQESRNTLSSANAEVQGLKRSAKGRLLGVEPLPREFYESINPRHEREQSQSRFVAGTASTLAQVPDLVFPYTIIDGDFDNQWAFEPHTNVDVNGRFIHNLNLSSIGNDSGWAQIFIRSIVFKRLNNLPTNVSLQAQAQFRSVATLSSASFADSWGPSHGFVGVRSWVTTYTLPATQPLQNGALVGNLTHYTSFGGNASIDKPPGSVRAVSHTFWSSSSSVWVAFEMQHILQCYSSNAYVRAACAYVIELESANVTATNT
jgi:hypothetical protein